MRLKTKLATAFAASMALAGFAVSPTASACGAEPFIGEICIVGFTFAPQGYALTNGQLLSIQQNTALFSLLGTTYGGNGQTTFALPDTRGRVLIGAGQGPGLSNYDLGQVGGTETVTLTFANMPAHTHTATTTAVMRGVSTSGNADGPANNALAAKPRGLQYSSAAPDVDMNAASINVTTTVGSAGGSAPFSITQPYVTVNYVIALFGIFPSRP